jgi:hypothetical protein
MRPEEEDSGSVPIGGSVNIIKDKAALVQHPTGDAHSGLMWPMVQYAHQHGPECRRVRLCVLLASHTDIV